MENSKTVILIFTYYDQHCSILPAEFNMSVLKSGRARNGTHEVAGNLPLLCRLSYKAN